MRRRVSYEYGSSNSQNFTFPNPLREHNVFLGAGAGIAGIAGLVLLFQARFALHGGSRAGALVAAVVAFALLVIAGTMLFQLFSQLRFFFGRGRPAGLARQLQGDETGTSREAEGLIKETLRQQALEYPEPADPISGLLYWLVPDLIYAPRPVRGFAERQFQAGMMTAALLAGLVVAAILGGGGGASAAKVSGWVAIILFVASAPALLQRDGNAAAMSVPQMAGLIAFAVLGPVLIALAGSALPPPPVDFGTGTLFLLLVLGAALHGLFFAAVMRHRVPPPSTVVSAVQDTWNISVNPAMITAEFMRAMQDNWWEQIPNRRYCRVDPDVNLQARSGQFHASMVEETQPVPFVIASANDRGEREDRPFASGNPAMITAINAYALVLVLAGSVSAFLLVGDLIDGRGAIAAMLAITVFVWALARAAFQVARFLTLRFDFRSTLVWMDFNGTFNAAEVAQGNRYTANLHTSSQVVQIEGMTFRLWMAQVHTVAFGKDGTRHIIGMVGLADQAQALVARLKGFITAQATMVAVGSVGDQERARAAGMMNAQMGMGNAPMPFVPIPPADGDQ